MRSPPMGYRLYGFVAGSGTMAAPKVFVPYFRDHTGDDGILHG